MHNLTKEILEREYFVNRLPKKTIAKKYGVSETTIYRLSGMYGVRGVEGGIQNIDCPWRSKEWLKQEYATKSMHVIAKENNTTPNVIFKWIKRYSIKTRGKADHFVKGMKFTPGHKEAMSRSRRRLVGSLCPNWKGGISLHKRSSQNGTSQNEWSLAVRKRDGKCMECSSIKDLHAHHIIPWAKDESLRFDTNNGVTLCKPCHYRLHGFSGYTI